MRRTPIISALALSGWFLAIPTATAQDSASAATPEASAATETSKSAAAAPQKPQLLEARYRFWGESADIADFEGGEGTKQNAIYQNLRAGVNAGFGSFTLKLEADAFTGRLAGDEPAAQPEEFAPSGTRADGREAFGDLEDFVDPRALYLEYRSLFLIRAGLQGSSFGMGVVANDGNDQPNTLFNQRTGGDRGMRFLVAARPFAFGGASRKLKAINLGVGADMVYRDDNASFIEGDRARQFVSSLFYSDADPRDPDVRRFLGAYFAYRDQTDDPTAAQDEAGDPGDFLRVAAFDITGMTTWKSESGDWTYGLGLETALVTGKTNRAYPQSGQPETGVLGLGSAAKAEVRWNPMDLAFSLGGGYASGDANSDDEKLYRFRFDPNYKVGLVLFDHYIPAVTRTGYDRATDPERSGLPPKGVDGLISDGAVENAVFLNPTLTFGQDEGLLTGIGFLWARSAVPLADPYNTFANGGAPVGPRGAEASRDLGIEIDVAAQYRLNIIESFDIEAKAEYGILFPGSAFDDASGDAAAPQNLVRGRIALMW